MAAHRPIVLRTGRRRKIISSAKKRRRRAEEQRGEKRRQTFDIREVRRRVYLPNAEDGKGGEFRVPSFDPRAIGGGGHRAAVAAEDGGDGEASVLRPPVSDHDPGMDKSEEPGGGAQSTPATSAVTAGSPPLDEAEAGQPEQQQQEENVKEVQDGIRRYPWWVQLGVRKGDTSSTAAGGNGNGENTPFVMSANPETRRSHSAAILRLDTGSGSVPDDTDGSPPSRQRDRRRRRDTEADGDEDGIGGSSAEGEGDGEAPPPEAGVEVLPTPPGEFDGSSPGEDREGDGDDTDTAADPVVDGVEPDATTPPPPRPERPPASSSSEYMIVSGGFTDEDWSSFPVYAYDLSATHRAAPTTTTDPLSATGGEVNHADGPPPAGGWIRLGTGTSSELTKRQHEREHSSHGWGVGGQKNRDGDSSNTPPQQQQQQEQQPLWPPGRVGHVTAISSQTGDLFVFGGMMYYDREFHAEDTPVVWKATGITDGVRSASSSAAGWNDRHLQDDDEGAEPPSGINGTEESGGEEGSKGLKWTRIEARFDDPDPAYASSLLTRGEAAGGRWIDRSRTSSSEDREYLVFYGGLHIKSRDRYGGAGANTIRGGGANSGGYTFENLDVPLGDVWAFDMHDHTFTRLAGYPPEGVTAWDASRSVGTTYPIARTAHAATIDGDKLVIYGGMTMSADLGGWAATSSLPRWEMLDDVWAFDLVERRWLGRRDVYPGLARSYHSLVGRGDTLVACGGYRTAETIAGESIAFVFSDTLVSLPNTTRWYKAVSPTGSSEGLPHRLSHSSVLDSVGSTYVWGGRFRTVSQIAPSVWRLDLLHGDGSRATNAVALSPADPDGMDAYEAELQTLHLMVAVMIFMSVLFTTLYGTLRRGVEEGGQHGGNNGVVNLLAGGGGGGNGSGRTTRRGGVRQDVIDSFPVKTFDASAAAADEPRRDDDEAGARSRAEDGGELEGEEEEEACCAICLLEYEYGDEVRTLPCGHDFHRDCVDSWLWNNTSCPACRHSLSSVVPQSSSSEGEGEGADGEGDADGDAGGGGRAARPPSRWFVSGRMPVFLRRPVFSILSEEGEGEERHHGDAATTPSARRGGVVVDDDPADRYVASDDLVVGTGGEGERGVERVRPIGGRLGASFGRHLRPSPPQARPVMMELVTYNVSSDDPYRL